ncbi:hypothetical protein AaE_010228 [Aphanomyces astaci]|uniref:Uncharacterized protein n=1 Tax=Aphanomyces astaci TaxID=112090 RepID=A0A6A5AA81_APHAT|nr:hypothetical protein AaE_010228 [Aphanomyces astaci]
MTEGGRPKTDPSLKKAREKAKMQRYRKRQADLYTQLHVEAFHLESQVMHHANAVAQRRVLRLSAVSSLLPWKEVLAAIRDDMDELTTANDALRARSQAVDRLAKAMQRWVHNAQYFPSPSSLSSSLHASGTLCRTPWRHVTLDAAPATRTLGFDWITKNLCHNHELVFQQCHFPPITSPDRVADFGVDTTDGMERLQYIWRIQDDVAVPLSTVRDAFARPHFLSQVLGKHLTNTSSISPHISAAMQADEHCRFALDEITPDTTKIRMLCVNGRCFNMNSGPVPLEDEAARWGVDVGTRAGGMATLPAEDDVGDKEAWILQRITQVALKNVTSFQRDLCAMLATHSALS